MKTSPGAKRSSTLRPLIFVPRLLAAAICLMVPGVINAADTSWVNGTAGDWETPGNWQGGIAPVTNDNVFIDSGTVTVATGITVGVPGSSSATGTTAIGATAGQSSSLIIAGGGHLVTSNAIFAVGDAGDGYLEIQGGGILQTGGRNNANKIGNQVGSSGTAVIKDGGHWNSYGDISVGNYGAGFIRVETGGTLTTSSGASQIGHGGEGTLIIEDGGVVNHAGHIFIGNSGTGADFGVGTLIVERGGLLNYKGASGGHFILGSTGSAVGTAHISGTVRNINTLYIGQASAANNTVYIHEGGYVRVNNNVWYARDPTIGGIDDSTSSGTNAAYVAGTWDVGGYFVLGNNEGYNILDVATTGTVIIRKTGFRVTYGVPKSTAYVNVDGYLETTGGGYIIVAHYGNSYMHIGTTGTVKSGGYISIGQGDFYNKPDRPDDYFTAYSGTVDVEGYMEAKNYIRVANRLGGVLNLAATGTIKTGKHFVLADNNSFSSTGTATIAGRLDVGTDITVGAFPISTGVLDLKATSNVTAGGNYRQNASSVLAVELSNSRPPDTVDPQLTSPLIAANGVATLSGTLVISGADEIDYIGGSDKASQLFGIPIIRAAGGITGDFDRVVYVFNGNPDFSGLPDYIRPAGGLKVSESGPIPTRYDVGYGLAWNSPEDFAHGTFTIEADKTFTVDVQLSDRTGMNFTEPWDGKSLTKKGPGTLILPIENAYTGATTIESGTLRFTGPAQHDIGDLINNGVIDFYATDAEGRIGGYRTIHASSLAGNGSYRMDLDISTGESDRLIIDGDATGTHRLLITGGGAPPVGDEPMPILVTIGGVNDIDFSASGTIVGSGTFEGNFDYGLFKYEAQMLGNRIVIANTGLSPDVFGQIRSGPGTQSILWFDQQDNISRRLGELRAPRENGKGLDFWARGHASHASIGGGSTEMRISGVDIRGAELGTDYTWKLGDQRATLGIYAGLGNASQKFDRLVNAISHSTAESDMLGMGLYGFWLADSGWFANAAASISEYKNSFDSVDGSDNRTTADYKDHGFGVAIEGGRRFALASGGWFVEPAVQGAVVRLTRADYTTAGNHELSVNSSDTTVTRMRGAVRAGRSWKTERAGWMEIAARLAATRERSSGGNVIISSAPANRWRPNLDGNRFEAGVGFFWQFFESGQIYLDYEYAAGDNFNKPWGISFGFRLSL